MRTLCRLILMFVFAMVGLFSATAEAQVTRHPRVAELEKSLSREGLELMKGRFPDRPFLVTVKIDPLIRERKNSSGNAEKLPYFDLAEEEVVDEWDDPSISNTALLNRVRKIYVNISIPSNLSDDEVAELKTTLVSNLSLLEARDTVEISKRNWGALDKGGVSWQYIGWGALGWGLLMVGFFALFWYGTTRLGQAFKESQAQNNKSNSPSPSAVPAFNPESFEKKQTSNGDLKFNDPIKNREITTAGIRMIESHRSFPNLDDMMIFHKVAEEKPADLGALLSETPIALRRKIFSYSFGSSWLDAMTNPGEVNSTCVETLNKCLRLQRNDMEIEWQALLILVWRLGDKRKEFFRGMNQAEAFAILSALPKSMALEVARESFPGAWGVLLDPNYTVNEISKDKIATHSARATALEPLRDFTQLNKYRNEKELLEFLKTADPTTEKEIYQAAGEGSVLHEIRAPFYKMFDLNAEDYDKFVPMIRVEEWALAMFNISRHERKEVEKRFSDKQRFRYFEILKSYDTAPPAKARMGEVRERIAGLCAKCLEQWKNASAVTENTDEDKKAA